MDFCQYRFSIFYKIHEITWETKHVLLPHVMALTYATARSIQSAKRVAAGLKLRLPVITKNDSVFADQETEAILEKTIKSVPRTAQKPRRSLN